jgi:hypothetical protein
VWRNRDLRNKVPRGSNISIRVCRWNIFKTELGRQL